MMLTCEVKIDLINSEPHYVKFLFLGTSSIVPIFDFLKSYIQLAIHLNMSSYLLNIFTEYSTTALHKSFGLTCL